MDKRNKLKIGIVGAGKIVEDAHLPVLRTLPNISISWISDQKAERRDLLSDMYRIPAVSPEMALQQIQDVDVCLLAIPFGVRRQYVERCIQCDKAIYVEKPFAKSEADHVAMMAQFPPHKLAVGFQRRTYHAAQTLRAIINNGMLGKLQAIELTEANFTLSCGGAQSFRTSASYAGGGITIESSIHSLDLIQYLTSATDVHTDQLKSIVRDGIDYQVQCNSRLTISEGQEITVSVFISRLKSLPDVFQFHFENAVVALPTKPQFPLVLKSSQPDASWQAIVPDEFAAEAAHNINTAFALFWECFLNGIQNEVPNLTSACTSVITSKWVEQIYNSMPSAFESRLKF
jgi:UDP-N-acetyl-2-amino-2-deoxyglucuronate dehydrogenase